jgi:predicted MFS family arabinose efflux permease
LVCDAERRQGFRAVILLYTAATAFTGCLTWFVVPKSVGSGNILVTPLAGMLAVLRRPIVWAHTLVVVCAYCSFKGSDNYSLYAVQVLSMDEVAAARFTAYASCLRPVGALAAGVVADRFSTSRVITVTFLVLVISYSLLALAIPTAAFVNIIFANLLISFFAVFALRGIYFALLQESKTPKHLTGSTVGFISLVGYTLDVFFAPIGGRVLDSASVLVEHPPTKQVSEPVQSTRFWK